MNLSHREKIFKSLFDFITDFLASDKDMEFHQIFHVMGYVWLRDGKSKIPSCLEIRQEVRRLHENLMKLIKDNPSYQIRMTDHFSTECGRLRLMIHCPDYDGVWYCDLEMVIR